MQMNVQEATQAIKKGEVVAFPTETVYGLGGSIFNEQALGKIFSTKERPFFDPLIVHISSMDQVTQLAKNWSPLERFLAERF